MAAKKITKPVPATKTPEVAKTVSTPVRNTAIPKVAKPVTSPRQITHEMISKRAYEIWASGQGGSEHENWLRAESELRGA
jgi:hypothetical protein